MEDDYRPQDEYFEWDDIMTYKGSLSDNDQEYSSNLSYRAPLRRTLSLYLDDSDFDGDIDDFAWSNASSLSTIPSSRCSSGSLSSLNLSKESRSNPEIDFPPYEDETSCVSLSTDDSLTLTAPSSPILEPVTGEAMVDGEVLLETSQPLSRTLSGGEAHLGSRDDMEINVRPFRNVNYSTHEWCEEDLPGTWRYVISRRSDWDDASTRRRPAFQTINNVPRYENTLWRVWAQRRFQLETVSPDVINWMKSCDDITLLGPYMMNANSPLTKTVADCSRSNSPKPTHKPTLKRLAMSEILLRGSVPTFVSTRTTSNGEIHQTSFQAQPSYGPSIACPGMSNEQRQALNSNTCSKLGLTRPNKKVRFLTEVEQYEIVKVEVSAKHQRPMLRKIQSTTLESGKFPPPFRINTTITTLNPTEKSSESEHWSPDSLWEYDPSDTDVIQDPWLGGSDVELAPAPAPIDIEPPRPRFQSHSRNSAISVGSGALKHHSNTIKYEDSEVIADGLDYLIAMAGPQRSGSLSSPISDASSEDTIDTSDDDEYPLYSSEDVTDQRKRCLDGRRGGMQIDFEKSGLDGRELRILGEDDRDILEEYDLVLS